MDRVIQAIIMASTLADIKRNATAEEKKAMYNNMQAMGENCAECKQQDECPIYDALMK